MINAKLKRALAVSLVSAMAVSSLAACSSSSSDSKSTTAGDTKTTAATKEGDTKAPDTTADTKEAGSTAEATTEEATTAANTITGDPSAADAFVVWMWNDDVKKILDGVFAKEYADDYKRIVYVNTGGSDVYQTKVDTILKDQSNELYPDVIALEIDYVQKYVQSGQLLALEDLGITADDLKDQYQFNKDVCTNPDDGKQYASFWQATPGAWEIRADLAKKYLGTDDATEIADMFSTWEKVEETAKKVYDASEGNVRILAGWTDLMRVYSNHREKGISVNDVITIDDSLYDYFEEAKKFYDNKWTYNTNQWDTDWGALKDGEGTKDSPAALAYTGCPWFTYWCMTDTWKNNTILVPGPQAYYWGGSGIAATVGCADKDLAAKIIKAFTCDADFMKKISEFNCDFVNNASANKALIEAGSVKSDYMFSQDYMTVYSDILDNMVVNTSVVTPEDKWAFDNFNTYVQQYLDGKSIEEAIANFKADFHDIYDYLVVE